MEALDINQLQTEYTRAMQAVDSQIEAGNMQENIFTNEIRLGLRLIISRLGEVSITGANEVENGAALLSEQNKTSLLPINKLIGIGEAANILGCNIASLRRWSDAGHIKTHKTPGGKRRYKLNELTEFIESH